MNIVKKKKYYDLFPPTHQYWVPIAPSGTNYFYFPKQGRVESWKELTFNVPANSGIISDYMCSNLGGRLCSNKLKLIIEENITLEDHIQWLPINLFVEETREMLCYFHLHFLYPQDYLSRPHCKFLPDDGTLSVPYYSFKKIKNREVFNIAEGYERIITIISDKMLKSMEDADCIGINSGPANVVYDEEESPSTQTL